MGKTGICPPSLAWTPSPYRRVLGPPLGGSSIVSLMTIHLHTTLLVMLQLFFSTCLHLMFSIFLILIRLVLGSNSWLPVVGSPIVSWVVWFPSCILGLRESRTPYVLLAYSGASASQHRIPTTYNPRLWYSPDSQGSMSLRRSRPLSTPLLLLGSSV